MSYFNVLAPYFLQQGIYHQGQVAGLSAAYYYGNVIWLLPVGFALDHFPLRKILLWAISGSVISAFLLTLKEGYSLEWTARFLCGFFGGTFSFVGGIRVLISIFPNRFSFFMGVFIAAGMLAGFVCQYPLLYAVEHIGVRGAMITMAIFGLLVTAFNLFYLRPPDSQPIHAEDGGQPAESMGQVYWKIFRDYRNWLDCLMITALDTPISVLGTLWGLVLLMSYYHFSGAISAMIVMTLFAGLTIGSVLWGMIGERYHYSIWTIVLGAGMSFVILLVLVTKTDASPLLAALLFFALGLFSSCQAIGFTWLTKNMRPDLIGRNSAYNSMILMGVGGGVKQLGAYLLTATPLLAAFPSASNLLIFMAAMMLLAIVYALLRKKLFKNLLY